MALVGLFQIVVSVVLDASRFYYAVMICLGFIPSTLRLDGLLTSQTDHTLFSLSSRLSNHYAFHRKWVSQNTGIFRINQLLFLRLLTCGAKI